MDEDLKQKITYGTSKVSSYDRRDVGWQNTQIIERRKRRHPP